MLKAGLLSPSRQIALQSPAGQWSSPCISWTSRPVAVLSHQPTNAAVANVQPELLQFFGHSWTAAAAQAETGLFLDMSQPDHVGPLSMAGRTATISPQASFADIQNLEKTV